MPKFRKRPVMIEAKLYEEANHDELISWCDGYGITSIPSGEKTIIVPTLEGKMTAKIGDWIIKGIKGEFYPCDPEIFFLTYDLVLED